MELFHPLLESYIQKYTTPDDELLREVYQFTIKNHAKHHMISGPVQGRFLEMISHITKPQRILEIGTFTGYSALCLAKGLAENGVLHTIELKKEDAASAKSFFDRSFFSQKIILHIGDALQIAGEIKETWDLVFIDADKENYIHYFNLVLPQV